MFDIPTKQLKKITKYLQTFYTLVLIAPLNILCFRYVLHLCMTPLFKKGRKNYRPAMHFTNSIKNLSKKHYLNKCLPFFKIYFLNTGVVS